MRTDANSMNRRRFLAGAAAAVGAAALAACGGGGTTATNTAQTGVTPTQPGVTPTAAAGATPAARTVRSQIDTANVKKGGSFRYGGTIDPNTFTPILSSSGTANFIVNLVFDGLVSTDPDTLQAIPRLATKWEIAPDNKTYTFTLKQGVKFHDGQPLTADDVKFTYDLLMNAKTGTPRAGQLNDRIAAIEVKDPATITFTLKDVIAPFLVTDLSYGIVPKHLLDTLKPEEIKTAAFSTGKPVGTGSFKLKEYRPGESVTLVANPDYHGGAPNLDQIIYKIVKDTTVLYQQLKTGELDWAGITPDFYDDATKQANLNVAAYDDFSFYYIGFNLDPAKTPLFQDVRVRQALCYALDRETMVKKLLHGFSVVAVGTLPTRYWAYQPDKIAMKYPYDPKKSAALLDEAGWPMGADGVRTKDGKKLAFSTFATAGNKTTEGYVLFFQDSWKAIGVQMTPQFEQNSTRLDTGDFETNFGSFGFGTDPDQTPLWDSKQHGPGFNLWSYSNPKVDELLRQGLHTLDQEQRKQIYVQTQSLVVADAPVFITDFPQTIIAFSKRVKNRIPNAVQAGGARITLNAEQWYVTDGK